MEREFAHEKGRINELFTRQDDVDDVLRDESSEMSELARRAREAVSEFETTAADHLKAATRLLEDAVKRANDPQRAALEQMRLRELARDRSEQRKFTVQILSLVMATVTSISAGYFVSRSGSHEGAHEALTEQHLLAPPRAGLPSPSK